MRNPSSPGRERYDVRAYEVDGRRELTLPALCDYLQDAASKHASSLGFGITDIEAHGLKWVLCRLRVVFPCAPRWGEMIEVETWPAYLNRVYAHRDFLLSDGAGKPLGAATSSWMVLSVARRLPMPLPDFVCRVPVAVRPRGLELPAGNLAWPARAVPIVTRTARAGWSDLDFNRHVNHVRYIAWCLDALPPEERAAARVCELDIQFLAELYQDDEVCTETTAVGDDPAGRTFRHRLRRPANDTVLALAQTTLAPYSERRSEETPP
jgi:medium-chain acyl-[acyl-carrier-protein] hydrolase